jgi:hypothetical protein
VATHGLGGLFEKHVRAGRKKSGDKKENSLSPRF